jgi:hypothetical protein
MVSDSKHTIENENHSDSLFNCSEDQQQAYWLGAMNLVLPRRIPEYVPVEATH